MWVNLGKIVLYVYCILKNTHLTLHLLTETALYVIMNTQQKVRRKYMNYISKELINKISHCEELKKAVDDNKHPCHTIVCSQIRLGIEDLHIPEPYNGNLDTAKILFISSNPSIDTTEVYPTLKWNDSDIENFFTDRLADTPKQYWSAYWKAIEKWSSWILPDIPKSDLIHNIAITEVVHCKSRREFGVGACQKLCSEKWLNQVVQAFNGKYIVVVGNRAKDCFNGIVTDKLVAYTSHSNARGITDEQRRESILSQLGI